MAGAVEKTSRLLVTMTSVPTNTSVVAYVRHKELCAFSGTCGKIPVSFVLFCCQMCR